MRPPDRNPDKLPYKRKDPRWKPSKATRAKYGGKKHGKAPRFKERPPGWDPSWRPPRMKGKRLGEYLRKRERGED